MPALLLGLALVAAAIAVYAAAARMPHGSGMPLYVVATLFVIIGGVILVLSWFGEAFMARFH
jgi:hypothetical protein